MGSILISNDSVAAAMHELLAEMQIPRPKQWGPNMERYWLEQTAIPAYLSSLEKLGELRRAVGFDVATIAREFTQGQIRRIQEAERERTEHE